MKKLIAFDYAKYQAGEKAVYRNLEEDIIQVIYIPNANGECLLSVYFRDNSLLTNSHHKDGSYWSDRTEGAHDLMLEIDVNDEQEEHILHLHKRIIALENFVLNNYQKDRVVMNTYITSLHDRIIALENKS